MAGDSSTSTTSVKKEEIGTSKEGETHGKEQDSKAVASSPDKEVVVAAVPTQASLEGHARIDDPVEPPARNAPKNKGSFPGATELVVETPKKSSDEGTGNISVKLLSVDPKSILSRLFDPDRKQKPQLWTHIKLVAPGPADQPPPGHIKWRSKDAIAAYCLKCKKQFTYTRGTSKTISRHMQAYHGLVLNEGSTPTPKGGTGKRSAEDAVSPPPLKKRKPEIERPASVLMLKWIVSSFQRWSIVSSPGLQAFVRSLISSSSISFALPSTEDLIRAALNHAGKVRAEIRAQLKDHGTGYSILCQEFKNRGQFYTGVKVAFCTDALVRKTMSLGVNACRCNKSTIRAMLQEYDLNPSFVTSITLQGVPDTVNLDFGEVESLCALEKINMVVLETIASFKDSVDSIVSSVDEMVSKGSGWIRFGSSAAQMPSTNGPRSVKSIYTLLQSYNSPRLNFSEKEASWTPTEGQQLMIQALMAMLKPFSDAYVTLSRETYPTIGLAIPVFRRIRDVLGKLNIEEIATESTDSKAIAVVKDFHQALLKSFSTHFASILKVDPPEMWTIPLDPRLIHMGGLSDKEKESVTKMLIEKVKEERLVKMTSEGKLNSNEGIITGPKKEKKIEESTMGGIFWGDDTGDNDKAGSNSEGALAYARANVDRYFTAVKSQRRIEDPLSWWKANQTDFPELCGLAKIWLGAILVGSEPDGRSDYSESNIEMITFLHDNLHLI